MEVLISVVFFTVPVFLIVSSIILSIKYSRIKNTILSVLLLINAFLPMSLVATFVSGAQKNILTLILSANICLCAFDLIVIFILPFLSDRKLTKGIENTKIFSFWCFSLLLHFLVCIFLRIILSGGGLFEFM